MLTASLREERRLRDWRDYVAQNLWAVGKLQLTDPASYPWPSWVDIAEGHAPASREMTGDEIYSELKKRWGGGE